MAEGKIMKALSGFYYVKSKEKTYQTKGRGVFRNQAVKPLVGDLVHFDILENNQGYITDILPRQNELVRPPIANIDQVILMSSTAHPPFSALLLDRILVIMETVGVEVIIVATKMDLASEKEQNTIHEYRQVYEALGYPFMSISIQDKDDIQKLGPYLEQKTSVVAGQSGVGKSSLLNALKAELELETASISKSLGRGRHTTRHVELMDVHGGLVADTPGFSLIDFSEVDLDLLEDSFVEIRSQAPYCKFRECTHRSEPGCAVKTAVEHGEVASFRYDHYLRFYKEIQSRKPRY